MADNFKKKFSFAVDENNAKMKEKGHFIHPGI